MWQLVKGLETLPRMGERGLPQEKQSEPQMRPPPHCLGTGSELELCGSQPNTGEISHVWTSSWKLPSGARAKRAPEETSMCPNL